MTPSPILGEIVAVAADADAEAVGINWLYLNFDIT